MKWLSPILVVVGGLYLSGCSCRPNINVKDTSDDEEETDPPMTADTAILSRCPQPENPENGEPSFIEMELRGCGAFDEPQDGDEWQFELPHDAAAGGWLSIRAYADSIGSFATPHIALQRFTGDPELPSTTTDNANFVLKYVRSDHYEDPIIAFPHPKGHFNILLTETDSQGGSRYYYDLLVTTIKQPVVWTVDEVTTDNDDINDAQVIDPGDVVFGDFERPGDDDWYKVVIPAGKGTLRIDVDAYEFGSAADVYINLRDINRDSLDSCSDGSGGGCYYTGAPEGSGLFKGWDPNIAYESPGDEDVYIKVYKNMPNDLDGHGAGYWYVFTVELDQ